MVNGPGPGAETSVKMLPNNKFPYVSSQEKRVFLDTAGIHCNKIGCDET
jgi:hypothetical protein